MILVLIGALLFGLCLGILGSGGSMISTPLLVLVLQRPEKLAIAESLAIVGTVAFAGSIPYLLRGSVQWRSVLFFGVPAMLGIFFGSCCSYLVSGKLQLLLFSCLLLSIAWLMLLNKNAALLGIFFDKFFAPIFQYGLKIYQKIFSKITHFSNQSELRKKSIEKGGLPNNEMRNLQTMGFQGIIVGGLTGLLGIGGGVLIVPSLMALCGLSLSSAVGTSLIIIGINAWVAFGQQLVILHLLQLSIDWKAVAIFASIGIAGSLIGGWIAPYFAEEKKKKLFGALFFALGLYLLLRTFE